MLEKIRTFWWFIRRPVLYPAFYQLIIRRLNPHPLENSGKEATEWCVGQSISTDQYLNKLLHGRHIPLRSLYPVIFEEADQVSQEVPVKMGGNADLDLLYYLSESISAKYIIETGVAYGWSSLALLLSLSKRGEGTLYSSDMPYAKMGNEVFVGCVVPDHLKQQWKLIRKPDITALREIIGENIQFDLVHYDSDKTYVGRKWAYPYLWKNIRPGGIFISDDIQDNVAFMEFAQEIDIHPEIIYFEPEDKFIGILHKIDGLPASRTRD